MTTIEAFQQLTHRRGWHKDLGINEKAARSLKKRVTDGSNFSLEKVEEVLLLAGFKVVREKEWAFGEVEEVTSSINYLLDVPEAYWTTYKQWEHLHSHMLPENMAFIEKIKMWDIYYKKLNALDGKLI